MKVCCSICKEVYFDGDLLEDLGGTKLSDAAKAHIATHSWPRRWVHSLVSKYYHWRIKRAFQGTNLRIS